MPSGDKKNKSARGTRVTRVTRGTASSSSSSSSKSAATARATSPRAATARATSPRAATARATSPMAATATRAQRAATARATARATAKAAAAAFSAAVAAKDTNRLHNLPIEIQRSIMKIAKKKPKLSKYAIYKKIYRNRQLFIDWLDEIKRDGVDDKKRVRNPLREGGLIYTDKGGLYPILYKLCFQVLQWDYNMTGVPRPVKIFYKKLQLKFFNRPPDSPPR